MIINWVFYSYLIRFPLCLKLLLHSGHSWVFSLGGGGTYAGLWYKFWCLFKSCFCLKLWSHWSHWYGFWSVWISMWDSKCLWDIELYGHRSHLKHFSPSWVFLCTFKVYLDRHQVQYSTNLYTKATNLSGKLLPHILQCIGFSLVWSFWTCSLRSVLRPHVVGQSSHW